jgi:hypothetical protein
VVNHRPEKILFTVSLQLSAKTDHPKPVFGDKNSGLMVKEEGEFSSKTRLKADS